MVEASPRVSNSMFIANLTGSLIRRTRYKVCGHGGRYGLHGQPSSPESISSTQGLRNQSKHASKLARTFHNISSPRNLARLLCNIGSMVEPMTPSAKLSIQAAPAKVIEMRDAK